MQHVPKANPPPRDDPKYVDFLEAQLSLMFVPLAALDMSGGSPEGCQMAYGLARMAVDASAEFVMQLMERWTGHDRSPVMTMWLSSRRPDRN